MLIGGWNFYHIPASFSCCKHYTTKNLICQAFSKKKLQYLIYSFKTALFVISSNEHPGKTLN